MTSGCAEFFADITDKNFTYQQCSMYVHVFTGDYMEYIARIKKTEGKKVLIEVRTFKIIEVSENLSLSQLDRRSAGSCAVYRDSVRIRS